MKILTHLSGGIDSLASTLLVAESGENFVCFFVDYGQTYVLQEWRSATRIASALKSFPNFQGLVYRNVQLELNSKEVNEYVPIRNAIIGMLSANYALSHSFDRIAVGTKSLEKRMNDPYSFNDCTSAFWKNLSTLCSEASEGERVEFFQPLIQNGVSLTKKQAIEIIIKHHIPLNIVWSCYNNNLEHCGDCYHCKEIIETGYFSMLTRGAN